MIRFTTLVVTMDIKLLDGLRRLGFNEYEARVYVEMLRHIKPTTAYEIGKLSGVPRAKVYEVVDNLRKKQIIVQIEENPKKYLPVDPDEVFSNIEKGFTGSVRLVREELQHLEKGETVDYIFNISGKQLIIERAKEMIFSAQQTVLVAVDGVMFEALQGEMKTAKGRGVDMKIVFYGDCKETDMENVYCHRLQEPDTEHFTFILLDIDFREVLAGTMSRSSNEGHGFWTKSVYLCNIMQDNIIHEISLGILEEKLGLEQIHRLTGYIPDRIWEKAMMRFDSKFHIRSS
jgi:sugar-specific transcriptional regulator TrmB